jgi:hypothetical protein
MWSTVMTQIDYDEEFSRDRDWYAVDLRGKLGHFKTAGFRSLPIGFKNGLERDAGGFKSLAERDRYT